VVRTTGILHSQPSTEEESPPLDLGPIALCRSERKILIGPVATRRIYRGVQSTAKREFALAVRPGADSMPARSATFGDEMKANGRSCVTTVRRPLQPVRVSARTSPAIALRPSAASSSRKARNPPSDALGHENQITRQLFWRRALGPLQSVKRAGQVRFRTT
jgi:hypothetical protein